LITNEELKVYLLHLLREAQLSRSTVIIAVSALR
jgi:hypothetical protein